MVVSQDSCAKKSFFLSIFYVVPGELFVRSSFFGMDFAFFQTN